MPKNTLELTPFQLASYNAHLGQGAPAYLDTEDVPEEHDFYSLGARRVKGITDNPDLNETENDIVNLDDNQLLQKYGNYKGRYYISSRNRGISQYQHDSNAERSWTDFAKDTAISAGGAFLNASLGMGAAGAGLVNNELGAYLSEGVDSLNETIQGYQSNALAHHRKARDADTANSEAINKKKEEIDIANGIDPGTAKLRRLGRDSFDTVLNNITDPVMLAEGGAQAVGSLAVGGPTSKLVRGGVMALAKATAKKAVKERLTKDLLRKGITRSAETINKKATQALVSNVNKLNDKIAWSLGIGMMEAGGAYQQTVADIMKMSTADLYANSPVYGAMVEERMEKYHESQAVAEQNAKTELANMAGLRASIPAGAVGTAAGRLSQGFEHIASRAFTPRTLRSALMGTSGETLEEYIEGASGQYWQNEATKRYANKEQDIMEGVGTQAGLGALYAAVGTGGLQAPGVGLHYAGRAGLAGAKGIAKAGAKMAQRYEARKEEGTIYSKQNLILASKQQQKDKTALEKDVAEESAKYEKPSPAYSEYQATQSKVHDLTKTEQEKYKTTNRTEAVFSQADKINSKKEITREDAKNWAELTEPIENLKDHQQGDSAAANEAKLNEDDALQKRINASNQTVINVTKNSAYKAAKQKVEEFYKKEGSKPLTETNTNTAEGSSIKEAVLYNARKNPSALNEQNATKLLKENNNLSNSDKAFLRAGITANSIARSASVSTGSKADLNKNYTREQDSSFASRNKGMKPFQTFLNITKALAQGDTDTAKVLLEDLRGMAVTANSNQTALERSRLSKDGKINTKDLPVYDVRNGQYTKLNPKKAPKYEGINKNSKQQNYQKDAVVAAALHDAIIKAYPQLAEELSDSRIAFKPLGSPNLGTNPKLKSFIKNLKDKIFSNNNFAFAEKTALKDIVPSKPVPENAYEPKNVWRSSNKFEPTAPIVNVSNTSTETNQKTQVQEKPQTKNTIEEKSSKNISQKGEQLDLFSEENLKSSNSNENAQETPKQSSKDNTLTKEQNVVTSNSDENTQVADKPSSNMITEEEFFGENNDLFNREEQMELPFEANQTEESKEDTNTPESIDSPENIEPVLTENTETLLLPLEQVKVTSKEVKEFIDWLKTDQAKQIFAETFGITANIEEDMTPEQKAQAEKNLEERIRNFFVPRGYDTDYVDYTGSTVLWNRVKAVLQYIRDNNISFKDLNGDDLAIAYAFSSKKADRKFIIARERWFNRKTINEKVTKANENLKELRETGTTAFAKGFYFPIGELKSNLVGMKTPIPTLLKLLRFETANREQAWNSESNNFTLRLLRGNPNSQLIIEKIRETNIKGKKSLKGVAADWASVINALNIALDKKLNERLLLKTKGAINNLTDAKLDSPLDPHYKALHFVIVPTVTNEAGVRVLAPDFKEKAHYDPYVIDCVKLALISHIYQSSTTYRSSNEVAEEFRGATIDTSEIEAQGEKARQRLLDTISALENNKTQAKLMSDYIALAKSVINGSIPRKADIESKFQSISLLEDVDTKALDALRSYMEEVLNAHFKIYRLQEEVIGKGVSADSLVTAVYNKALAYLGLDIHDEVERGFSSDALKALCQEVIECAASINSDSVDYLGKNRKFIEKYNFNFEKVVWDSKTQKYINVKDPIPRKLYLINNGLSESVLPERGKQKPMQHYLGMLDDLIINNKNKEIPVLDDPIAPPKNILHTNIEYTKNQKEAIKAREKTKFYLNTPFNNKMQILYEKDPQAFLDTFSTSVDQSFAENTDNINNHTSHFNIFHLQTIKSKNTEIQRSQQQVQKAWEKIQYVSEQIKLNPEEGWRTFKYDITRVGRFQQQGTVTAHGSKYARESYCPTKSTLNLDINSNDNVLTMYKRGIAQQLGIKINQMSNAQIDAKFAEIETSKYFDEFKEFFTKLDSNISIKNIAEHFQELGIDVTFPAFNAMLDYCRFKTTEDPSKFESYSYIEADGTCSGYCGATINFTTGEFSTGWINQTNMFGIALGVEAPISQVTLKAEDFYQSCNDEGETDANTVFAKLKEEFAKGNNTWTDENGVTWNYATFLAINSLLGKFTESGYKVSKGKDSPGRIEYARSDSKKITVPLIYGKGGENTAISVAELIEKGIQEMCSLAIQSLYRAKKLEIKALKNSDASSKIAYPFASYFHKQNKFIPFTVYKKQFELLMQSLKIAGIDTKPFLTKNEEELIRKLRSYKFSAQDKITLANNLKQYYTDFIINAVRKKTQYADTAMGIINRTNQACSLLYRLEVKKEYANAIAKLQQEHPNDWQQRGLSPKQENDILTAARKKYALIVSSKTQKVYSQKNAYEPGMYNKQGKLIDNAGSYNISGNTSLDMSTVSKLSFPQYAGVSIRPNLNIAKIDANHMQQFVLTDLEDTTGKETGRKSTKKNPSYFKPKGSDVYDGFHHPIDLAKQQGTKLNQIALNSFNKENVFRDVYNSFSRVLNKFTPKEFYALFKNEIYSTKEDKALLAQALNPRYFDEGYRENKQASGVILYKEGKTVYDSPSIISDENLYQQFFNLQNELNNLVIQKDAWNKALQTVSMSVDHYTGLEAPAFKKGLTFSTAFELADHLERARTEFLANPKATVEDIIQKEKTISDDLASLEEKHSSQQNYQANKPIQSGEHEIGNLFSWLKDCTNLPKDLLAMVKNIRDHFDAHLKGYRIFSGTREECIAQLRKMGLDPDKYITNRTNGITLPEAKVIFILSNDPGTVAHELIHAALKNGIYHYTHENLIKEKRSKSTLSAKSRNALKRIEQLLGTFLDKANPDALAQRTDLTETQKQAMKHLYDVITKILKDGPKVASEITTREQATNLYLALQELVAYGLTDPELRQFLQNEKIVPTAKKALGSDFYNIFRSIIKRFKEFLFGTQNKVSNETLFSNLTLDTNTIISEDVAYINKSKTNNLTNAVSPITNNDISIPNGMDSDTYFKYKILQNYLKQATETGKEIAQTFMDNIANPLVNFKPETALVLREEGVNPLVDKDLTSLTDKVTGVFNLNAEAKNLFESLVSTFTAASELSSSQLLVLNDIFQQAIEKIKPEDLASDMSEADKTAIGQQRFNTLFGINTSEENVSAFEQNNKLSTFLALACVSPQIQQVLSNIKLDSANYPITFDGSVQQIGSNFLETLGSILSEGKIKFSANMKTQLENISARIRENVTRQPNAFDQLNNAILQKETEIGNSVKEKIDTATESLANVSEPTTFTKVLKTTLGFFGSETNYQKSLTEARNANEKLFKHVFGDFLGHIVSDLIGDTETTRTIDNLVKEARVGIQQTREMFNTQIPSILKQAFKNPLTEKQWSNLTYSLGKCDIGFFGNGTKLSTLKSYYDSDKARTNRIKVLIDAIRSSDPLNSSFYNDKAKELAHYIITGETTSNNLLRNARAIERRLGSKNPNTSKINTKLINNIDELISLYSISELDPKVRAETANLLTTEENGMSQLIGELCHLRSLENEDIDNEASYNMLKGFMPSGKKDYLNVLVSSDHNQRALEKRGFKRIGTYNKSSLDTGSGSLGIYFCGFSNTTQFNEGALQVINQTAGGVDKLTGLSSEPVGGYINEDKQVKAISARSQTTELKKGQQGLIPVFDQYGRIKGYERSAPIEFKQNTNPNTNLADLIGMYRGRKFEEYAQEKINQTTVDATKTQYENDPDKSVYVDLFEEARKHAPIKAALDLIPMSTIRYAREIWGDHWMVRPSQIDDLIGYRSASVSDIYTGVSNWSPETQKLLKNCMNFLFRGDGDKAFEKLCKWEQNYQYGVNEVKTTIVIKSALIPGINILGNCLDGLMQGMSPRWMAVQIPKIFLETEKFMKIEAQILKLQSQIRGDSVRGKDFSVLKAQTQIKALQEVQNKLSIKPLIDANEFSTISTIAIRPEDRKLRQGRTADYMKDLVNKLPPHMLAAAKQLYIARDTALFQGLEKATQYGDFIAKVLMYKHLIETEEKTTDYALKRVREHFVNYDKAMGRDRQYLESMGLMWFYNYKLRTVKSSLDLIRNHPLRVLAYSFTPWFHELSQMGSPMFDNLIAKIPTLYYTLGPRMMIRGMALHPIAQMFSIF